MFKDSDKTPRRCQQAKLHKLLPNTPLHMEEEEEEEEEEAEEEDYKGRADTRRLLVHYKIIY